MQTNRSTQSTHEQLLQSILARKVTFEELLAGQSRRLEEVAMVRPGMDAPVAMVRPGMDAPVAMVRPGMDAPVSA